MAGTGTETEAQRMTLSVSAFEPRTANRSRVYTAIACALPVWICLYVYVIAVIIPTAVYWLSYYAVNYRAGFVRRGLGGHLLTLFPESLYFTAGLTLVWGSVAVYSVMLGILMWRILFRGRRAERRLLVALSVPVMPFAFTFAVFGPRPELYAASLTLFFAVTLTRLTSNRSTIGACVAFGLALAAMAYVHEAIPIEFALGAVLAISVLARPMNPSMRLLCTGLAIGPGLISTAIVSVLGRRDVSGRLCEQLPHRMMPNTIGVPPERFSDYLLGRYEHLVDYHDWVCRYVIPYFGVDFQTGLKSVSGVGAAVLIGGFLHGLVVSSVTIWLLSYFTGVHWRTFLHEVRGGLGAPLIALAMMAPVFATGVDWIRWWTVILINVSGVFLIFTADRREIESPVSPTQFRVFVAVVLLLAFIPLSAPANYSTGWVTV